MRISNVSYTASGDISAVIDDAITLIYDHPKNPMRQRIAAWELEGNIIPPFKITENLVVDKLSRVAFRLGLLSEGVLDTFEIWIAAQDRATQIAYEDSDDFNRSEPKLQEAFAAVGYSPSQVDDFFVKASQR